MLDVEVTQAYQSRLLFQQVLIDITQDALTHTGSDFYQRLLERAISVIPGAEAGSVLMRADDGHFYFRAVEGFPLERLRDVNFPEQIVKTWHRTITPRLMYHRHKQTETAAKLDEGSLIALRDYGRLNDIEVTLSVPVLLHERLVAVLNLDSFQAGEVFDRDATSRAEAIAAHVAVALERARLEQQVNHHNLWQERVREILLQALAETDEVAFLRYVLEQVIAMIPGAQAGSVFFKAHQDSYHMVAAVGYKLEQVVSYAFRQEELEATVDTDTFMPSLVRNISHALDTMSREQTVTAFHELGDVDNISVTLVMPIAVEGSLAAAMYLDNFDDASAFDDTLGAAGLLTAQLSVFLRRFKVEKQNRQRVRYQEALLAVLKQALGTRDDASFYHYVLKQAVSTIPGAQRGSILAKTPEQRYVFVAAEGYDQAVLRTITFEPNQEPILATQPVRSSYVLTQTALAARHGLLDAQQRRVLEQVGSLERIHAALILPIYARSLPNRYPEAIMYLDNFDDEQAFDQDVTSMAEGFASQVSAVLTRLHLQRMHKQNARQQRLLTDIEALLLRIADIQGFFPALADRLLREDEFDIAFIELFYLVSQPYVDSAKQPQQDRQVRCEVYSRDPNVQKAQRAMLEPIVSPLHDLPDPLVTFGIPENIVYVNDLSERVHWGTQEAWHVAEGITAGAVQVLPLLQKGRLWGRCNIFFRQAHAHSPINDSFARKVVGSIAVALDKQADREALEREVVRMRAVVAANDALRDTFSQDDVFRQTVSSAERHMGARAVWLLYAPSSKPRVPLELDPDSLAQYVVAKAGQHDVLQPDSFLCQRAYKLATHAFANKQVCSEHLSDVALFAVPLITEQQHVPGVLVVATNTISQSESAFAEALAQAASSALVRLELVTARAQEAAAYRALANFGATIEAINDVDTLMQLGIKQLMAQLELEAAYAYDVHYQQDIVLRNPVTNGLADNIVLNTLKNTVTNALISDTVGAAVDFDASDEGDVMAASFAKPLGLLSSLPTLYPAGMWGQHPPGFNGHFRQPFSPTAGVMLEVLESKKARYIEDYQRYARAIQPYLALGTRTLLVIPVLQRAQIVKIIVLSSYQQVQPLSEEQLAIARSFVRRLENAIERVDNMREVESTREATLRALGLALEYRDFETKGHSERVVELSLALADKLSFDAYERQALRWGAYLHDIGKVGVPDSILLKPGKLSEAEFTVVKKHTVLGYSLCRDIPFLPAEAIAVVRSHHERWNGGGYPDGLVGESIPLMARLFSLVDVYDALTNPRVYKHAWDTSQALQEIRRLSGVQFDPELTQVFLEMISQRKR